ncbi:hypothetical protein [Streptomyces azureus]|uniref:Secreted protein n=1 Tax=Streptomyces azureus TaxID=146537 RepID=A0A0K8PGS9_STRAJ|nr:hypothetical protein [Streptomyces azureus]GAP46609.1 uncharacterized protein SAZU_1347 [Streptomyces azureus]
MRRFRKAVLMAAAIGSTGVTGAGTSQVGDAGEDPSGAGIGNTQLLKCEQTFNASLVVINAPITASGDNVVKFGNFCSYVGPRQ